MGDGCADFEERQPSLGYIMLDCPRESLCGGFGVVCSEAVLIVVWVMMEEYMFGFQNGHGAVGGALWALAASLERARAR